MIITRLSGGMGNQMFQYAMGRALSLRNNTTLGLDISFYDNPGHPIREYDLGVFSVKGMILKKNEIPFLRRPIFSGSLGRMLVKVRNKLLKGRGIEQSFHFDPTKKTLGDGAYLDGYWQSQKYFADHEQTIREDFVLRAPLSEEVQKLGEQIRSSSSVCVHIRRADYVGNAFHDTGIGQQYYEEGLRTIAGQYPIDTVYVFSDDTEWCKEHLSFGYQTFFVEEAYAGVKQTGHFWLMQQCKHFVIANSSYSWWAAWLAAYSNKIVIAPKRWFTNESINTTDLIPEEWIRI